MLPPHSRPLQTWPSLRGLLLPSSLMLHSNSCGAARGCRYTLAWMAQGQAVKVELSHISNPLTLSGLGLNMDLESESTKKTELIPENSAEGELTMKVLEGMAGQTGVSHRRHRKMAPFLDCMVRERRWCSQNPAIARALLGAPWQGWGPQR